MSCQSQYLKKLHESTLQDVIDDLVKVKEKGGKTGLLETLTQQNSNS